MIKLFDWLKPQSVKFWEDDDTVGWDRQPQVIEVTERLIFQTCGNALFKEFMRPYRKVKSNPSWRTFIFARQPAYTILKARLRIVKILFWLVRKVDVQ